MAESAEIPDAKDPFEKRVAIAIALIAVVLSLVTNAGDNAKTEALLKSIESSERITEASNQWAYYQSKSIKGHAYEIQAQTLPLTASGADGADRDRLRGEFQRKVAKYEKEKAEIEQHARAAEAAAAALKTEAKALVEVNDTCDQAALVLQIAIILCSVAILAHLPALWWIGMAAALAGTVRGAAILLPSPDRPVAAAQAPAVPGPATPAAARPAGH